MTIASDRRDRLVDLLPAVYRIADTEHGDELRALLELITEQAETIRDRSQQLWDDFFVETAQRWVVPYIGALVGNIPLHDLDLSAAARTAESLFDDLASHDLRPPGAIRIRADVAKTIYYRRRKGTPAMLEELARDVTGWSAHIVEFFKLLRWDQHLEHVRLGAPGCAELRGVETADRIGGPWDNAPHTVDVRRINEWDGWYGLPNVGFFLWRLGSFPLTQAKPRAIGMPWKLTFSPLGQDAELFSSGRREPGESALTDELMVEMPIRPAAFFEDLRHNAAAPTPQEVTAYYGDPATSEASVVVFEDVVGAGGTARTAIPATRISCANLGSWGAIAQPSDDRVLIDVKRGRLVAGTQCGENLRVSYFYGFSAPMGGGEYDRERWLVPAPVTAAPVKGGGMALGLRIAAHAAPTTVIEIGDSETYDLNFASLTLAAGESLTVQAVNNARPLLRLLNGSLSVDAYPGSMLTLGGVVVEGGLTITRDLGKLRLLHSTLVPGRRVSQEGTGTGPSLDIEAGTAASPRNVDLEIQIAFSIVGALRIPSTITKLWILDSIVDGAAAAGAPATVAIADAAGTSGPPAHIERATVFGSSRYLKLEYASESIFTDRVEVTQQQHGCVRFCYLAPDSITPQQYRCQPALESALVLERTKDQARADAVKGWLVPTFTSERYGDPGYAQLRLSCPEQIRIGAEDGSEMGAFSVLKQPQREANLRIRLGEYLPVGLEAGVIYVS